MSELPREQLIELIALARERHIATFIDRALALPPADFSDVISALSDQEQRDLVPRLPAELIARIRRRDASAGQGAQRTAGALMTRDVIAVSESDSIAFATESVRRQAISTGNLTEVFVIDSARRLCGVLSLPQLIVATPSALTRDIMSRTTIHVRTHEDQAVVARVIRRYALTSAPVVDENDRLVGRVAADAVRDVIVDELTEDFLHFGGVSARESMDASWSVAVRSRLPWLYANLVPAFGAAAIVFFFKGTLTRVVTLAVWMPVVAGVGGNAGTQALATAVRRLVLYPHRREEMRALMWREAGIGAANGVAIGAIVAAVAVLLGESWRLGLIVWMAMTANLALAGVAGAAMPIVLKRSGRDPTLASPVVVTALMDACGFALLLALASLFLKP